MCSGTRLFVGNLPQGVSDLEQGLKDEFSHYGEVKAVELKSKKDVEGKAIGQFAFVTLQADTHSVNQCIHEFSEQEWRGSYLNVSVAKESFLERLQREREENERKKKEHQNGPEEKQTAVNGHIQQINIKMPEKKTVADYEDRKEIYTKKHTKETPKNERYNEKKTQNLEEDIVEDSFVNNSVVKKEPKRPKRPKNRIKNIPVADSGHVAKSKDVKILTPADEKRLKSMQNMRSAYNEKKSLIKMALSSVDKKVNKITFDDDGQQIEEAPKVNGDSDSKSIKRKDREDNGEWSEGYEGKIKKPKATIFDDDEEEFEDDGEINFEVKEHFQGETGQKLLQLQSRYQSDKRFILDERFIDNDGSSSTKTEREETRNIIKDKKRKDDQTRDDAIAVVATSNENDEDETEMDIDGVQIDEKRREIEILEGILGTSVKTSSRIKDNLDGKKHVPIKTMLRYDPSRPDHDKFMSKPQEKDGEGTSKKMSKKEKKEMLLKKKEEEEEQSQKNAAPEVSQERYYKVNQSLKQVIQSEDKKPFSLLSMFGKATVDDESTKNINDEASYRTETIKSKEKVKYPVKESNPFKYDSDTDDEREGREAKRATAASNTISVGLDKETTEDNATTPSTALVNENFFFVEDDFRLQEGIKFFMDSKPTTERSRVELKNLVKKRIKNNVRNERSHHNKVQHNQNQRKPGVGNNRHPSGGGRGNFRRR